MSAPSARATSRPPSSIHLRRTTRADVPALFQIQLDPGGNDLAGTTPRDLAAFTARWEEILREPPDPPPAPHPSGVTPRVIVADGVLAGSINIVSQDGADWIGYWLDREYWGRGIATRAIALMIAEFPARPLMARVVPSNVASVRALERNGFRIKDRIQIAGTDRFLGSERLILMLV